MRNRRTVACPVYVTDLERQLLRRLAGAAGAGLRLLAVGLAARAIAESLAPATG